MVDLKDVIKTKEHLREVILHNTSLLIYGAHLIAENLLCLIKNEGYIDKVIGFAVSSHFQNPTEIDAYRVIDLTELSEMVGESIGYETLIIVAIPEKFWEQVWSSLKELSFNNLVFLGLNTMTDIMGDEQIDYINDTWKNLYADKDFNDTFCINLWKRGAKQNDGMHLKMPVLSKTPLGFSTIQEKLEDTIEKVFLEYSRKLISGCVYEKDSFVDDRKCNNFLVYRVCSQFDQVLENVDDEDFYWICNIQAGAALGEKRVCVLTDNTGENISAKNKQFAEMTAMYWIWKNDKTSAYKGLCHYRRTFGITHSMIQNMLADDVDVILTTPRVLTSDIKNYFYETPVTDAVFTILLAILKDLQPDYYEYAKIYYDNRIYFPNNMVIAKAGILDFYCSWIFPILFRLEEVCTSRKIETKDRYIAYSAEILSSLFFDYHMYEWKTVCVDYSFIK